MEHLGWEWVPTMMIGQGCKVHLRSDELPRGRLVVQVTHHFVAVIDGVIHDERLSLSFRRDQHFVCDGFCGEADCEERTEGGVTGFAAIEAEDELVEIGLKMLFA